MGGSGFDIEIVGNIQACRTEAEVSWIDGAFLAVVYESADGWQVEPATSEALSPETTAAILTAAQSRLQHYVNRRGENPPPGLSGAGLSLWLMEKADGTAMGVRVR